MDEAHLQNTVAISPDDLIVATFRRVLAEAGPRQAEVLRRCAIPRWWDASVLGVLREREDGNERVLELLAGYSFVRSIGGGRYAYPDEVRAALLDEWGAERPDELRAIERRLAEYFDARAAAALPPDPALPQTAPGATISVRPAGAWDLWRREALYHLLMASPSAGLERLRAAFDEAESTYRLADAEALLQTTVDIQLDEGARLWLRHMRARLDRQTLRLDAAETGQWARAVELYRASLDFFERAGDRRRAAEVVLRLGEAYRGLGVNTGGWYVPRFPRHALGRALGEAWYALLALPFYLVAVFLRATPGVLPRPRYLASYQNWLLVRLYRTAQRWYERAHDAFVALGDEVGDLRAGRQQAEILLLFGHADDALARLDELRARPAARDPYRRLWLESDRALALLELGRISEARPILDDALIGFHAVGDFRGEAAVLALQGRAAADAGALDEALDGYRSSLARFRSLRYAAARELVLYALRAWRRSACPAALAQRIGELIEQEPEKRYVARFPRSLLPLIQALVLGVVPLALLLATLVTPTKVLQRVGQSPIVAPQTTYNLWNGFAALLTVGVLSLALYTLVALALIFFIPLEALEREQPDYLISHDRGIDRYDYRGALAQRIGWEDIKRWIRVDRALWRRPMPLFSLAFLDASNGADLRVDGITGWYDDLQGDIALHLRDAGNPTLAEDWGYAILRSKCGALLALGLALLLLYISSENSWIDWLFESLAPPTYAALSVLSFSGLLILIPLTYWFVSRPLALARALDLRDRWPWIVGLVGLGMVLVYLIARGNALPIEVLNIAVLLCGVYIVADTLFTLLFPRRRWLGWTVIAAALAAAVLLTSPRIVTAYYDSLGQTYLKTRNYADAQQAGLDTLTVSGEEDERAEAWVRIGSALYQQGRYRASAEAYSRALALLPGQSGSSEAAELRAVILYNRAWARAKINDPGWRQDLQEACRRAPELCQNIPR